MTRGGQRYLKRIPNERRKVEKLIRRSWRNDIDETVENNDLGSCVLSKQRFPQYNEEGFHRKNIHYILKFIS